MNRILPGRSGTHREGFTLPELLAVIVIMGIIAAIAGPPMLNWVRSIGTGTAANMLAADIAVARVHAVREGRTASLRVQSSTRYAITIDDAAGAPVDTIKRVDVTHHQSTARLSRTGRIAFDSRGLLRSDDEGLIRGLSVSLGTYRDSIEVTTVGRVQRVD